MAATEFKGSLKSAREIEIIVTGRRSGRKISLPVWFVLEGEKLYLLPVKGSESDWYKNVLKTPAIHLAAKGTEWDTKAMPIADATKAQLVADKFRAKYGSDQVRTYYSKFDVVVEMQLA